MNIKAYFLIRVRKNISKYRLLNKQNSAITIMCYYNNVLLPAWGELSYESGASCLGAFYVGEMSWGEFYVGRGCSAPVQLILGL